MGFTLYKIFHEDTVIYLGRTKMPLSRRLYGHFFKKPLHREINIADATRIEYADFPTEADMFLYEIYFINCYHPVLNRDDKAKDELTITLPEVQWQEFESPLLQKWKGVLEERAEQERQRKALRKEFFKEKRAMKKELSEEDFAVWLAENEYRIAET